MGRPKKQTDDDFDPPSGGGVTGEYQRPDAKKAFDIYDKQIAPKKAHISTLTGDCSQPWADIKDQAHFPRPVMNFLINLLAIDDDAKRDHHLLALSEGLAHLKLFVPTDLVTTADGTARASLVPTGERKRPFLAAVPPSEPGDDFEASEEELAGQRNRPSVEKARAKADAAAEDAKLGNLAKAAAPETA